MDLQKDLTYQADIGDVFGMLCDEDFRKQVCEATHARSFEVSVTRKSEGATVRVSRTMDAPEVAKKFVGDTLEIVQVEEWGEPSADGGRTADLSLDIPGKPGSMRGKIELTASGGTVTESITGDIKVKIPIVGGKLEKEIARGVLAAIEEEGRVGKRWLAD